MPEPGPGTIGTGTFFYDLTFPQCSNGKDDDGDGKVDRQDPGCSGATDDNESDDPVHVTTNTVITLYPGRSSQNQQGDCQVPVEASPPSPPAPPPPPPPPSVRKS